MNREDAEQEVLRQADAWANAEFHERIALAGCDFSGSNQTLLMSVGERETIGAASALSNQGARI